MMGKTISHYKILDKIGEGGMGIVYKAEDIKLKRTVALKFLPPDLTRDTEAKERFIQEAQAASAIDHVNICNIHEINETDEGQLFIVMAYYEGETLKEKLKLGAVPTDEAIHILVQIANGLAAAHEAGITHRDIKPANIMITKRGEVKILDFGLAKLAGQSRLTKTGTTLGTVAYMSPEQAQGEPIDHRTDIWSLGVMLYEMLTGELPFKGENPMAIIYSILNESPKPVSELLQDIPSGIGQILEKCLSKKLDRRYDTVTALLNDLRSILGIPSIPIHSIKRDLINKIKSRRYVYVSLGAIILILLYCVLWMFLQKKDVVVQKRKSIAVLPFQNLSADGPHAFFASGLHDELLTQLSRVAALKVISRTSVMGYANSSKLLKQIASELGVGSIVEGSVQVAGKRLRVNVKLIDAATDAYLWSERYDRTLDDAFTLQSDVAQQIVAGVGAELSNVEQQGMVTPPTVNAEAYLFYLQAREYTRPGYNRTVLENAQKLYERAIELDPGFALAHAELSRVHGGMYWWRFDPSPERVARQREEAEVALRLAPDLPQAHISMGLVHYWEHNNYRRALEEFAIALKSLPNDAGLRANIGYVHRRLGNWSKAIAAFDEATQLNPRAVNLFWDLGGNTYRIMRRYAEAVRAYNRALILAPDFHSAALAKGWAYVYWQGQLDTLRLATANLPKDTELGSNGTRVFQNIELLYWERQADSMLQLLLKTRVNVFDEQGIFLPRSLYTAWAYQMRGDRSEARKAFDLALGILDSALHKLPDDWRVHAARGLTLAGLGRRDEALLETRWLQQSDIYRNDMFVGTDVAKFRAQILAHVGEAKAALEEIERLLIGNSTLSVRRLRIDPSWDSIREHPGFKALLSKYAKR